MKKLLLIFLTALLIMTLTSCIGLSAQRPAGGISAGTNEADPWDKSPIDWPSATVAPVAVGNRLCDHMELPDQSVPPKFEANAHVDADYMEKEYDSFSVTLDRAEFKCNSKIRIHVKNNNDKPYWVYPVPYLEKYDADSQTWERLIYAPDEAYYAAGWHMGLKDYTMYFDPNYVSTPMEEGEYRFIVFVGHKEFYSPQFNVTK